VSEPPLIPAPLYGLRTWGLVADDDGERLTGVAQRTPWPEDGAWLDAACGSGGAHVAPQPDCYCGIHAWHPRRWSARRVLASRFEVPGIVEAAGAAEVHEEGFRAERGRPRALFLAPGRNAKLLARLCRRYRAELVEVHGPDALIAWCHERGLGLDERTVDQLLGPGEADARRRRRRTRACRDALRVAAAVIVSALLLLLGALFAKDPHGPHQLFGRTGPVQTR
jgi:hypothetical protein